MNLNATQKKEMLLRVMERGERVSDVCKHYRISRKTFYKYKAKFSTLESVKSAMRTELEDGRKTRRNHKITNNLALQGPILLVVTENPCYGSKRLIRELKRLYADQQCDFSPATLYSFLKQRNLGTYRDRLSFSRYVRNHKFVYTKPHLKVRTLVSGQDDMYFERMEEEEARLRLWVNWDYLRRKGSGN